MGRGPLTTVDFRCFYDLCPYIRPFASQEASQRPSRRKAESADGSRVC